MGILCGCVTFKIFSIRLSFILYNFTLLESLSSYNQVAWYLRQLPVPFDLFFVCILHHISLFGLSNYFIFSVLFVCTVFYCCVCALHLYHFIFIFHMYHRVPLLYPITSFFNQRGKITETCVSKLKDITT